jgi:hypothetical protein
VHAGLRGLHGVELVVNRRRRAGQVEDLIDLHEEGHGHVVAHQLEPRVGEEVGDVAPAAGEEVVDAKDVVVAGDEAVAEVRTQEPGAARHQNFSFHPLTSGRRC